MLDLQSWTARWSDLWAMLAAVGTLLAVGVAIWSASRESRSRKVAEARTEVAERDREAERARSDRERADDRESRRLAQAHQVIAWVEHRPANPLRPHHDASGLRQLPNDHVVRFVNHSPAPVFEVTVHVYWQRTNDDERIRDVAVLPSGADDAVVLPEHFQEEGFDATGMIRFRDLNGFHWRRWENGILNELDGYGQELTAKN